jgi:hypothetical protein
MRDNTDEAVSSDYVALSGRTTGEYELEIAWERAIWARPWCGPYRARIRQNHDSPQEHSTCWGRCVKATFRIRSRSHVQSTATFVLEVDLTCIEELKFLFHFLHFASNSDAFRSLSCKKRKRFCYSLEYDKNKVWKGSKSIASGLLKIVSLLAPLFACWTCDSLRKGAVVHYINQNILIS